MGAEKKAGKKPKDKSKDGSAEVRCRRVRAAPVFHCRQTTFTAASRRPTTINWAQAHFPRTPRAPATRLLRSRRLKTVGAILTPAFLAPASLAPASFAPATVSIPHHESKRNSDPAARFCRRLSLMPLL